MDAQTAHPDRATERVATKLTSTIMAATRADVRATLKIIHRGATITMVSDLRSRGRSITTDREGTFHIITSSTYMEASSPNERQSSRSSDPNLASQAEKDSPHTSLYIHP